MAEARSEPGSEASGRRQLGRYELVERLGSGAFGTVYRAYDPELERSVAIKVPHQGTMPAVEHQRQLLKEARSLAQLAHPNIVAIHEVGRDGDQIYIVSDFVSGSNLAVYRQEHGPDFSSSVEMMILIARAVHHAHSRGIIHRDLKPSNIVVDPQGQPFVLDFGLARRESADMTLSLDGQIVGTPAYMSPEQARGEVRGVDRRSDIYSLGVIFYELLTGERPFRGPLAVLLHRVAEEEPTPPSRINPGLPAPLEVICLKAMAKRPEDRYASAGELADDLERFLRRPSTSLPPTSPPRRTARRLLPVASIAALLAMGVALQLLRPTPRAEALASGVALVREGRVVEAAQVLRAGLRTPGRESELTRIRAELLALYPSLVVNRNYGIARAVLDERRAFEGLSPAVRREYLVIGRLLERTAGTRSSLPLLYAAEETIRTYLSQFRSPEDDTVLAEYSDLGDRLLRLAAERTRAIHERLELYSRAHDVFVLIDAKDIRRGAFDRVKDSRLGRLAVQQLADRIDASEHHARTLEKLARRHAADPAGRALALAQYRELEGHALQNADLSPAWPSEAWRMRAHEAAAELEGQAEAEEKRRALAEQLATLTSDAESLLAAGELVAAREKLREAAELAPQRDRTRLKSVETRLALLKQAESALESGDLEAAQARVREGRIAGGDPEWKPLEALISSRRRAKEISEQEIAKLHMAEQSLAEERYLAAEAAFRLLAEESADKGVVKRAQEGIRRAEAGSRRASRAATPLAGPDPLKHPRTPALGSPSGDRSPRAVAQSPAPRTPAPADTCSPARELLRLRRWLEAAPLLDGCPQMERASAARAYFNASFSALCARTCDFATALAWAEKAAEWDDTGSGARVTNRRWADTLRREGACNSNTMSLCGIARLK